MQVSWTKLKVAQNCLKQYQIEYEMNISRKPTPAMIVGSAFHSGVARYLLERNIDEATQVADDYVTTAIDETWLVEDVLETRSTIQSMCAYYLPKIVPDGFSVYKQMVEFPLEFTFKNGVTLTGVIDAVLINNLTNEVSIMDWKTHAQFPRSDTALLDGQLHTYAFLLNKWGLTAHYVTQVQVKTSTPKPARINKDLTPSIAQQATTWDVWVKTLPEGIKAEKYYEQMKDKLNEPTDFLRFDTGAVTPHSMMTMQKRIEGLISLLNRKARWGAYNTSACAFCSWKAGCYAELHGGTWNYDIVE